MKKALKKSKYEIKNLFAQMEALESECKSYNDVNYKTMSLEAFNAFKAKYFEIYVRIKARIDSESNEEIKVWAQKEFATVAEKMRSLLIANLGRILYPLDNCHISARELEDLPQAVKEAEEMFTADVEKAIRYFGDSFKKARIRASKPSVIDWEIPETVEDMLSSEKRWNWREHTIKIGYPVPRYLGVYRHALPKIIRTYFEQEEKELS